MRTKGAFLALAMGGLMAGGCIQAQRTIKVNADGSGTVVDTTKLIGMAAAMKDMGESTSAQGKINKEAAVKKKALAQGLTYVSTETTADGAEKVTYSFKDITKASIGSSPAFPDKGDDKEAAAKKDDPLTFRLAKSGNKSVLTVVVPKDKPAEKKPDAAPKKKSTPEEEKQAMAMMKGMMAGLKIATVVEVNGTIAKTTSPNPAQGSTVTLMEIDFDKLGEDGFKKLSELEDSAGPPTPEQLKGLKGVTFTEGEVVIEFTGK